MNAPVKVSSAFDKLHSLQDVTFRFKKDKMGNKRADVKARIPVLTQEGVANILTSGDLKQWALLEEAMYDVVRSTMASDVADENFNLDSYDLSKLTWEKIANMPKEDRRSSQIPEEQWVSFAADYQAVMPALTNKTAEQVKNATEVFVRKLVPVKTNKGLVGKLKEQLAIYSSQPSAEQFTDILDLLVRRCDTYLAADDMAAIVGNL